MKRCEFRAHQNQNPRRAVPLRHLRAPNGRLGPYGPHIIRTSFRLLPPYQRQVTLRLYLRTRAARLVISARYSESHVSSPLPRRASRAIPRVARSSVRLFRREQTLQLNAYIRTIGIDTGILSAPSLPHVADRYSRPARQFVRVHHHICGHRVGDLLRYRYFLFRRAHDEYAVSCCISAGAVLYGVWHYEYFFE